MAFVDSSPSESFGAVASVAAPVAPGALDGLAVGSRALLQAPSRLTPTVLRLLEMGLTAGTPVAVTRRAPGGDPIEIRVRGTRLCVRRADAALFAIALVPGKQGK